MRNHKKHLDFEINLIPCIDLLSVCICFLLLTAVWVNVGSMNVKQAVGGQSAAETEKKPLLWVFVGDNGDLSFDVQESKLVPNNMKKLKLSGLTGKVNLEEVGKTLAQIKSFEPNIRTALIQPKKDTEYESIISLMDEFKKVGMNDLGVAPL